jgi:hypothetical protein
VRAAPSQPPPAGKHHWFRVTLPHRLCWGWLVPTGPGEERYVRADRTVDGPTYECERCGCVRVFAWLDVVRGDDVPCVDQVALHGFDWDSLAPMRSIRCELLERPE